MQESYKSSSRRKLKYVEGGERLTLSDLSGPLHSFPDGEVDQDPGQSQSAHQGPAELSRLLQTAGELMHVASVGTHAEETTQISTLSVRPASCRHPRLTYSQNSVTVLVRLVVSVRL